MDLDNKSDEEKVEIKDDNPISLLKNPCKCSLNPEKYNIVYA